MYKCKSKNYFLYKLHLNKFEIDNMVGENNAPSTSVRLMYNERSFFLNFKHLHSKTRVVDSLNSFDPQKEIFIVVRKIDDKNFIVLWMGDCEHNYVEIADYSSGKSFYAYSALLSFLISAPLIYFFFKSNNADYSGIYFTFGFFPLLMFVFSFYAFIKTFDDDNVYIDNILTSNLMGMKETFISLESIETWTSRDLSALLPKEFNSFKGVVTDVQIVTRVVSWYECFGNDGLSGTRSYKKIMIKFSCANRQFVFEFKDANLFSVSCGKAPPFIAYGDIVELFWFEGIYETKMPQLHADDYENALPVICLYNHTSNTLFQSRKDITPAGSFEIIGSGLRDTYQEYYCF